jgi:hypothetical protein
MDIRHARRALKFLEADPRKPQLGARTRHECRIRELRARHEPTPHDLREIAALEEFLRTVAAV